MCARDMSHTNSKINSYVTWICICDLDTGIQSYMAWIFIYTMSLHTYSSQISICGSATGWRRLIGSPKLQIIFHKRASKYRLLLRKTTYKDKGSHDSTPPCTPMFIFFHISLIVILIFIFPYFKCAHIPAFKAYTILIFIFPYSKYIYTTLLGSFPRTNENGMSEI